MGRFNMFAAPADCPRCGKPWVGAFQSDVGDLQYSSFEIGDDVFATDREKRWASLIRPAPGLEEKSFWATGIDRCPRCGSEVWVRIEIRQGRFAGVKLIPSPAVDHLLAWGLLEG